VMIGDKTMCEATGHSKKESQQNAARLALQKIITDPELPSSF
jgi:dsRNA-specific ribonuclease